MRFGSGFLPFVGTAEPDILSGMEFEWGRHRCAGERFQIHSRRADVRSLHRMNLDYSETLSFSSFRDETRTILSIEGSGSRRGRKSDV